MGRRRIADRMAGWMLALAVVFGCIGAAGCGQADNGENRKIDGQQEEGEIAGEEEAAGTDSEKEKIMGRYLEEENDSLKGELNVESELAQMEDGSLVVISGRSGKWISKDNGVTWEKEELVWYEELNASNWVMNVAVAKDGYVAVIYEPSGENQGSEDGAGNVEDDAAGEETNEAGEENNGEGEGDNTQEEKAADREAEDDGEEGVEMQTMYFGMHPRYRLVAPDGSYTELEISYKENEYINNFVFSDDGRLFGSALGGKVYEIDRKTGSCHEVIELAGWAQYMSAKDGRLLLADGRNVTIVDLTTGETVADPVLDDFIKEQGSMLEYSTAGIQPLLLLPGEDGILYLIFEKGIYRHVIGGNVIEQIADGALNSLGDPSCGMSDGLLLEDDVFLLLCSDGRVMRYTYDPNVSAVPQIQLCAYSLVKNEQLQTVISSYQAQNPDVYIRYEIGIDGNSAATREDALKKLNTEIAAGKGPDIFILDDMPMDSYVEKGVLMDLAPYLEDKGEDKYFTNIINALQTPEGTYGAPAQFHIALLVGKKDEIEGMTDLEAIAEMVENYRERKETGMIFGARGEEEMLNKLLPACAPAWKNGEGKIDKDALTEFYQLAERIWKAEKGGIDDEMKEQYEQWLEDMRASGASEEEIRESQFSVGGRMLEYLVGEQEFAAGIIDSSFDFDMMISCFKIKGKTDSSFVPYSGQTEGVFVPDGIIGISRTTAHQDIALEVLGKMLDDDGWNGMPVNKEKCMERFRVNATEDGSSYGSMGVSSQDGSNYIGIDIYPASEEEIALLVNVAEEGKSPYIKDSVLESAVCEAGVKVLRGEMDASAGAEEVMQKTAIYMSE
ncbi:MAG TPA: hypothetical protein DCZ40_14375 [Lachnospiraceae bacterium]|nr:hypothetical protein [Lachnospiraceae bacterium]